jgi:hypothetical protein
MSVPIRGRPTRVRIGTTRIRRRNAQIT